MVPNLSTAADVGGHRQCLRRGRQILDRGFEVLFPAVDGDDARATLGQKPDGGAADEAGSPDDDGDPAIQANSIGHFRVSSDAPVVPDFWWFGARHARTLIGCDYFIWEAG
jgi:hypothetical protein